MRHGRHRDKFVDRFGREVDESEVCDRNGVLRDGYGPRVSMLAMDSRRRNRDDDPDDDEIEELETKLEELRAKRRRNSDGVVKLDASNYDHPNTITIYTVDNNPLSLHRPGFRVLRSEKDAVSYDMPAGIHFDHARQKICARRGADRGAVEDRRRVH